MGDLTQSTEQHDGILDALEAGDLDAACGLLHDNMTVGIAPLLERLAASERE